MKNISRDCIGAGMVDYVLPTLLVGAVAGTGLYYLSSSGVFKNNLMGSLSGRIDETKKELAFGTDSLKPGLYKNADGTYSLITKSGNTVPIPEGYYDSIKGSVEEYLNQKAAENATSVGEETTGAFGGEGSVDDVDFLTGQYAEILKDMAEDIENPTAKTILKNLAAYTAKISGLQTNLKTIKGEITVAKENYETSQSTFNEARKDFINYLSNRSSPDFDPAVIKEKFETYRDSYYDYREKTKEYRDTSKEFVKTAADSFKDMKKETGIGFELLLFLAKSYDKIPEEAKNIAIPVGDEVKNIKDNIQLTKENVSFLKSVLNEGKQTISSEINTAFETLNIILDESEASNSGTDVASSDVGTSTTVTDGTSTKVTTENDDGTKVTTTTNADGSSTTTATSTDGTTTITKTSTDGTTTVTTTGTSTDSSSTSTTTSSETFSSTTSSSESSTTETKPEENLEETKDELITMITEEMTDSEDDDVTDLADNTGIESSVPTETDVIPDDEDEGVTEEKAEEIVDILEDLDVNDQEDVEDAAEEIIGIIGIEDDSTESEETSTSPTNSSTDG